MLSWTVCIGCPVCACSRKGHTHPTETGFPASAGGLYPHGSPRRHPWDVALLEGCMQLGAGLVRGHQHASGTGLISVPPIQACWQYAWCLACVELCVLGREGSMRGDQILQTKAMAKQLPLYRMCFGNSCDLLYLSVRIVETLAIGNDWWACKPFSMQKDRCATQGVAMKRNHRGGLRHVSTHNEQVFSKNFCAHGGYCHCGEVQANAART